jgi:hypothetical protein
VPEEADADTDTDSDSDTEAEASGGWLDCTPGAEEARRPREVLERHRELRVVVCRRPRPHRVPERERLLALARILVRAGEDELDLSDPPADHVPESHRGASPARYWQQIV